MSPERASGSALWGRDRHATGRPIEFFVKGAWLYRFLVLIGPRLTKRLAAREAQFSGRR